MATEPGIVSLGGGAYVASRGVLMVDVDLRQMIRVDQLKPIAPAATPVLQAEQNGTGHAVRMALAAAPDATGTVVVLNGDGTFSAPSGLNIARVGISPATA